MNKKERIQELVSKNMKLSIECDELQAALGECQAGREACERDVDRWQSKYDEAANDASDAWMENIALRSQFVKKWAAGCAVTTAEDDAKQLKTENDELRSYNEELRKVIKEKDADLKFARHLQNENAELRAQLDTIHEHTVDFVTGFQPLVETLLEYQETAVSNHA